MAKLMVIKILILKWQLNDNAPIVTCVRHGTKHESKPELWTLKKSRGADLIRQIDQVAKRRRLVHPMKSVLMQQLVAVGPRDPREHRGEGPRGGESDVIVGQSRL